MENLTPGAIVLLVIGGLLAVSEFINRTGSAVQKIVQAWKAWRAPNEEQDDRLADLESWRKEMTEANLPGRVQSLESWRTEAKGMLANDKKELTAIHDSMRVSHLAQLALLDHALNGNNIDQMQDAKDALVKYLADK